MITRASRVLLSSLVLAAVVLSAAAPVAAHTTASAAADDAGRTRVTLAFSHGCGTAPTIALRVQLPADTTDVLVEDPEGWTSTVSQDEIRWDGGSVPDGVPATFTFAAVLTATAGTRVTLPSIQLCPGGAEEAWIEPLNPDGTEPASPAPTIVVPVNATTPTTAPIPATGETAPTTLAGSTAEPRMAIEETAITREGSPTNTEGLIVGGISVGAIVIGALVLWLRHRAPRTRN